MLSLYDIKTEYEVNPIGLDVKNPRFSWKLYSDKNECQQTAYQVVVVNDDTRDCVWNSGKVESSKSVGIVYAGRCLKPCTRYRIEISVWDNYGERSQNALNYFETGFRNTSQDAWKGAMWIGAPEKYITAEKMGVFTISSKIKINEGGKGAGIFFGANDERLKNPEKNIYGIQADSYILYEVSLEELQPKLKIFRVGYHPEDDKNIPYAVVSINQKDFEIITEENKYDWHELKIDVIGNRAYAYIDDHLIDSVKEDGIFGIEVKGRNLNPLGAVDTITFPRLCDAGYYTNENTEAEFGGIEIHNHRTPKRKILHVDEKGIVLNKKEKEQFVCRCLNRHSLPMFRRDFEIPYDSEIKAARLYIAARGIYDCKINGNSITDTYFNPGASQYTKHLMYQTYDVTNLVLQGKNGIGVTLSSGWWCDDQTFELSNYNYYGDMESFIAMLCIKLEDGRKITIVSDTRDWTYYGEGPFIYSGFFQGEIQDGRRLKQYDEYSYPGYSFENEKTPVVITNPDIEENRIWPEGQGKVWPAVSHKNVQLIGDLQNPIREYTRISAKYMTNPVKDVYIYDLGQEIAGIVNIKLSGKEGQKVTIRYGEMCYPNLPEYDGKIGMLLTENYRDAESIDQYILRGDAEGEIFTTKFTFHGFRYIEISGIEVPPTLTDVEGIALSSINDISGNVSTSNPLVNKFVENVKWSQLSNFISIPTDCPQRNERMGWAGDAHVFCRAATYQSEVFNFFRKYLQCMKDLQEENGALPNIAPIGGGFGGITYEVALIFITWELYQQYGDANVIKESFSEMEKWCDYVRKKGFPGMVYFGPLSDWLAMEETDSYLVWNAFYARAMDLMHKMSLTIGKIDKAEKYKQYFIEAKKYWSETFVDERNGITRNADGSICDTESSYAIGLSYHLFYDDQKQMAYANLARKSKSLGNKITTGFFGVGLVNFMLSEGGYEDIAYKKMLQTEYPSWLYPVTQGATTIWERWNSYTRENGFGGNNNMNSFNHYALGSVIGWLYENVLGIKRDELEPGFKHFILKPEIKVLDSAEGGIETLYGRINSSWRRNKEDYLFVCDIPCNTTATLILQIDWIRTYKEEIGSGHYEYVLSGREQKVQKISK